MAGRKKKPDLKDVLSKVQGCLSLLPGKEERQKVTQIIPEIIHELQVLQEGIHRFPSESEIQQVSHAIHTLVSFFDSIKDKPLLAETLFPKKAGTRKAKTISIDIDGLLKHLEEIPTENIIVELTRHKKDTLVGLSAKLNITANKKLTKDALAGKIFNLGFANRRGYDLLSGKHDE